MWVSSLGEEDPLEEQMATHASILAWKVLWTERAWWVNPWGCKELDMTEHLHTKQRESSLQ